MRQRAQVSFQVGNAVLEVRGRFATGHAGVGRFTAAVARACARSRIGSLRRACLVSEGHGHPDSSGLVGAFDPIRGLSKARPKMAFWRGFRHSSRRFCRMLREACSWMKGNMVPAGEIRWRTWIGGTPTGILCKDSLQACPLFGGRRIAHESGERLTSSLGE